MAAYGSDSGLNDWLASQGYSLPAGSPVAAVLRQRATDYMDAVYGPRLKTPLDADDLPANVERALYALAYHEAVNPGSLSASAAPSSAIKRERVGELETEYFAGSGDAALDATVRLSIVEGLMAPFLIQDLTGTAIGVWSVGGPVAVDP